MPNMIGQDQPGLQLHALKDTELPKDCLKEIRTGIQVNFPTGFWGEIRSIPTMFCRRLDVKPEVIRTVREYF